jgi:hypothetical protein|tara:strand:- start:560 stop:754 length:195 start_codon:yes stop_codon:yes gene_type:complete
MAKFRKVPKTKGGTPKKYVRGAKSKSATEKEIKSTSAKYKAGKLTKEEMNRIAKRRSKSAKPKR